MADSVVAVGHDGDQVERLLTPQEVAERDILRPALRAWTQYLGNASKARELPIAHAQGLPLRSKQRPLSLDDGRMWGFDGWVNPRHAHLWLTQREQGSVPPLSEMVEALVWMGARPASTIRGEGEQARRSPHRDVVDWYRVTLEITWRLMSGDDGFVPVLRGMPGRPVEMPTGRSPSARREALRLSSGDLLRLLAAMVAERTPTLLLSRATDEGRPLVLRRGGRPSRSGWPNLERRFVVLGRPALVEASREMGARLRVPAVPDAALRVAVDRLTVERPDVVAWVDRVRTPDTRGQVRRAEGWVRVSLDGLGCKFWSDDVLDDEVTELRSRRPIEYLTTQDGRWNG